MYLRYSAGKGHNGMLRTTKVTSYKPIPVDIELVGEKILDAAFKVHTSLGPGLLESVYEACLAYEIRKNGLSIKTGEVV
jgi:hypothetical protein